MFPLKANVLYQVMGIFLIIMLHCEKCHMIFEKLAIISIYLNIRIVKGTKMMFLSILKNAFLEYVVTYIILVSGIYHIVQHLYT